MNGFRVLQDGLHRINQVSQRDDIEVEIIDTDSFDLQTGDRDRAQVSLTIRDGDVGAVDSY
jgi:hypothetical protein